MAGNISPIFARVGKISWGTCAAAVTGADLTSGTLVFTADSTNGSILSEVRIKNIPGTNLGSATSFRVWINNGSALNTTTNNTLIAEITIPTITANQSASTPDFSIVMPRGGLVLPPSYRVYATIGAYSTGTLLVTAIGGDY